MEGKLKILEKTQKSEEIVHVCLISFFVFGDFDSDVVYRIRPCLVRVY